MIDTFLLCYPNSSKLQYSPFQDRKAPREPTDMRISDLDSSRNIRSNGGNKVITASSGFEEFVKRQTQQQSKVDLNSSVTPELF